jgi:hypothetical protein
MNPRDDLLTVMRSWLEVDTDVVDILMGVALGIYSPGEPLWLLLVDAPGAGKTELLRAFRGHPLVHCEDKLTPHRLITGLRHKDAEDLFPQLDGKLLVIKDFTLTLQMRDGERDELLADLRGAFDGFLDKGFGSGAGNRGYKAYELRRPFGLVAGVTPIIERFRVVMSVLGERFLKLRMNTNAHKAVAKAISLGACDHLMREVIRSRLHLCLDYYGSRVSGAKIQLGRQIREKIASLAELGSKLRSELQRNRYGELEYVPVPEIGTRLAKQLVRLAGTLAVFRNRQTVEDQDYRLLVRVVQDSIPEQRLRLIRALAQGSFSTSAAARVVKLPESTAKQSLEDLWVLGVVERVDTASAKRTYEWALSSDTTTLLNASGLI